MMKPAAEVLRQKAPRNLKIVLEYDGRAYVGWERQKNGPGIQTLIEDAIQNITRERTTVNGSGRTDAGVHALGQVASFTLQNRIGSADLHRALNAVLPDDVVIKTLEEVSLFFHARFSAKSKSYRYRILNSRIARPLDRHLYWQVFPPLDIPKMQEAATLIEGRRDFAAFCKEPGRYDTCVRDLMKLSVTKIDDDILVEARADGFLYNMVRILVGTLVYVGLGKIEASGIAEIFESGDRNLTGPTVPACGLALHRVFYEVER
ncbi:MAG: tRNA pseudouridine(38-40) synthase TruA [Planctomycetota bacterium]